MKAIETMAKLFEHDRKYCHFTEICDKYYFTISYKHISDHKQSLGAKSASKFDYLVWT